MNNEPPNGIFLYPGLIYYEDIHTFIRPNGDPKMKYKLLRPYKIEFMKKILDRKGKKTFAGDLICEDCEFSPEDIILQINEIPQSLGLPYKSRLILHDGTNGYYLQYLHSDLSLISEAEERDPAETERIAKELFASVTELRKREEKPREKDIFMSFDQLRELGSRIESFKTLGFYDPAAIEEYRLHDENRSLILAGSNREALFAQWEKTKQDLKARYRDLIEEFGEKEAFQLYVDCLIDYEACFHRGILWHGFSGGSDDYYVLYEYVSDFLEAMGTDKIVH